MDLHLFGGQWWTLAVALPKPPPLHSHPKPSYLFCVAICNLCVFCLVPATFLQDSLWLLELLFPESTEIRIVWLFTIQTKQGQLKAKDGLVQD